MLSFVVLGGARWFPRSIDNVVGIESAGRTGREGEGGDAGGEHSGVAGVFTTTPDSLNFGSSASIFIDSSGVYVGGFVPTVSDRPNEGFALITGSTMSRSVDVKYAAVSGSSEFVYSGLCDGVNGSGRTILGDGDLSAADLIVVDHVAESRDPRGLGSAGSGRTDLPDVGVPTRLVGAVDTNSRLIRGTSGPPARSSAPRSDLCICESTLDELDRYPLFRMLQLQQFELSYKIEGGLGSGTFFVIVVSDVNSPAVAGDAFDIADKKARRPRCGGGRGKECGERGEMNQVRNWP